MALCGLALLLGTLVAACGGENPPTVADPLPSSQTVVETKISPPSPQPDVPLIVVLGDSLSAGLGVGETEAFPALLEEQLCGGGTHCRIVNAGVSGDTTAGGLRRLDWLLTQEPDLMLVELGANDGLRGQPIEEIEANLRGILERLEEGKVDALLVGMRIPPNYGPEYAERFAQIYPKLAKERGVPLLPFLLEKVAGIPELNQADGIHPTAEGQQRLAETLYPFVEGWLKAAAGLPVDTAERP